MRYLILLEDELIYLKTNNIKTFQGTMKIDWVKIQYSSENIDNT